MSTPLKVLNVAGFVVGQTGTIDLSTTAPSANPAFINANATIVFYNESAIGFRFSGRDTGVSFDLPAGAWDPVPIPVGEGALQYQVLYVLSNPLVSQLIATYYAPNEQVPALASLGNSPIGGTALTTATAVANDGNPSGTEFIEASVGGDKKISDTNDGIRRVEGNPPGYYYWLGTLGGSDRFLFRMFPVDVGAHDWRFQYSNGSNAIYLFDGTTNKTVFFANNDGSIQLANGNANFDLNGNSSAANDTLRTGIQESGHFVYAWESASSSDFQQPYIRFRKKMTNIPSSITLSGVTLTNISSATVAVITIDGFSLNMNAAAAGATSTVLDWVTVGN